MITPSNNIAEQDKDTKNTVNSQTISRNKKDAYYFPHDATARNDPKITKLRMKMGAEGYGIYFMILELLRAESDYTHVSDFDAIAYDLHTDPDKVKSVITDYDLFTFTEDGKYFYSPGFNRRMEPLDNIRKQRSEAGKKSATKRWNNNDRYKEDVTTVKENCNNKSKVNKSKKDEREKENTVNSPTAHPESFFNSNIKYSIDHLLANSLKDCEFIAYVKKENLIHEDAVITYLKDFTEYLRNIGKTQKTFEDYRAHFISWLKKNSYQSKQRQEFHSNPSKNYSVRKKMREI